MGGIGGAEGAGVGAGALVLVIDLGGDMMIVGMVGGVVIGITEMIGMSAVVENPEVEAPEDAGARRHPEIIVQRGGPGLNSGTEKEKDRTVLLIILGIDWYLSAFDSSDVKGKRLVQGFHISALVNIFSSPRALGRVVFLQVTVSQIEMDV